MENAAPVAARRIADAGPEEHARRSHPDLAAMQRERAELERRLAEKLKAQNDNV